MGRKLTLRYDWIGPNGPIGNGTPPTLREEVANSTDPVHKLSAESSHRYPVLERGAEWGFKYLLDICGIEHSDCSLRSPGSRSETAIYLIQPYGESDRYLGVDFDKPAASLPSFFDLLAPEALRALQLGHFRLIIDYLSEGGGLDYLLLDRLHELIGEYGVPHRSVTYLCSNMTAKESYIRWCNTHGHVERMNVESWSYWENFTADRFRDDRENRERFVTMDWLLANLHRPREKHFLFLNRLPKAHRHFAMTLLLDRGLLPVGHVSWPKVVGRWVDEARLDRFLTLDHPEFSRLQAAAEKLNEMAPFTVDQPDLSQPLYIGGEHAAPYRSSYFSLIGETYYRTVQSFKAIFLSEKTWKAVANFHPFIYLAPAGTLQAFRELGYRSFSPLIDESYDLIEDDTERMLAVAGTMKHLCSFSVEALRSWYQELLPVVLHNYQHFYEHRKPQRELPPGIC